MPSEGYEWAIKNGDLEKVKSSVNSDKSLVDKELSNGRYPLAIAADYGQLEILKYLVAEGASLDTVDKNGLTALLSAIFENQIKCVEFLLSKGAKKDLKTSDGKSYLESAESDEIKRLLA